MNAMRRSLTAALSASMLLLSSAGSAQRTPATTPPTTSAPDSVPATPATVPDSQQTFLGPGMYVFQTRVRSATCNDDQATGYVDSFIAPIHGVSGSRRMTMHLLNSEYWSDWTIVVNERDEIYGDSTLRNFRGSDPPTNHFMVTRRDPARYTGLGVRSYRGQNGQPCQVFFDALLRRVDV